MVDTKLKNKVVLITGINNPYGVGAATAKAFAAEGAIEVATADLADPAIVPGLFDRAENAFGPVDVILFFASEQARWVTGQMIYVGGGHQMSL